MAPYLFSFVDDCMPGCLFNYVSFVHEKKSRKPCEKINKVAIMPSLSNHENFVSHIEAGKLLIDFRKG